MAFVLLSAHVHCASAQVSHETFDGWDLARIAGQTAEVSADRLDVGAGDVVEVTFAGPEHFRSVGLWFAGSLPVNEDESRVSVTFVDGAGAPLESYQVFEAADLSPEIAGATGLAGNARVTGVVHDYSGKAGGIRLSITGPASIQLLSVVWIDVEEVAEPARPVGRLPFPMNPDGGDEDEWLDPALYPKPRVYSRAEWGADAWTCQPTYCAVTHIGIHHSASAADYQTTSWAESAANVRAIQDYHMYTRGWCDIGYNFLIDKFGYIFEGRGGGDDVRGAHDGYNCGSTGVCLMGYFHMPYDNEITSSMMEGIGELGAWKCDQREIDPVGTSYYAGYGANMSNVYGHRDVVSTACPGDVAYAELAVIRQTIDEKLDGGGGGGGEIILDNPSATFTQNWATSAAGSQGYGADYRWRSCGITPGLAYWRPEIGTAGNYAVYFWWTQGANRNPKTTVGVRINGRTHPVTVNQQHNGGRWVQVGTWFFPQGRNSLVGVSSGGASGYVVVADAVRLVRQQ